MPCECSRPCSRSSSSISVCIFIVNFCQLQAAWKPPHHPPHDVCQSSPGLHLLTNQYAYSCGLCSLLVQHGLGPLLFYGTLLLHGAGGICCLPSRCTCLPETNPPLPHQGYLFCARYLPLCLMVQCLVMPEMKKNHACIVASVSLWKSPILKYCCTLGDYRAYPLISDCSWTFNSPWSTPFHLTVILLI